MRIFVPLQMMLNSSCLQEGAAIHSECNDAPSKSCQLYCIVVDPQKAKGVSIFFFYFNLMIDFLLVSRQSNTEGSEAEKNGCELRDEIGTSMKTLSS